MDQDNRNYKMNMVPNDAVTNDKAAVTVTKAAKVTSSAKAAVTANNTTSANDTTSAKYLKR